MDTKPTRRFILQSLLAIPPGIVLAGRARRVSGQVSELLPTPACPDNAAATLRQTAGPFYRPNSPRRSDLAADGRSGESFALQGFVLDKRCRPIADAMVEIWHADDQGNYDNSGYRWRGHQFTDAAGRWRFETIRTAQYSFRTAHYHFRIERPGGEALITQLYFPDHPRNESDRLFDPRLVMSLSDDEGTGRFDFVVDVG